MKSQRIIPYFLLALALLCAVPSTSRAASVSVDFQKDSVRVGDTFLLKISVNTDGKEINTLEGSIVFNNPSDIVSINDGGSILKLWPRKPSLENSKISFTGGTPSGVFGSSLRVFTVAIKPKTTRSIKISFENFNAYLNDGKGTKIPVTASPIDIAVLPEKDENDALASFITSDKNPPSEFSIELGRDSSLHEGKYFISFYATDEESGINRYEVTEEGYGTVRSGNVYVLRNQDLSGRVLVKAIDNAGNSRTQGIDLDGGSTWSRILWAILILAVVLGAVFVALKFIRKKR